MSDSFYTSQSIYSDPGRHLGLLSRVGDGPLEIARWINSLMQHPRGPEAKERAFHQEQVRDLQLRSVEEHLSRALQRGLLDSPHDQPKVGGLCRDFALIAVSKFRASNIPARLRVGFADYLAPGYWEDHWLCEWHDGQKWRRLDVEFAPVQGIYFDAFDVPSERFITASEAWSRVRDEPEIASTFGVSSLDLAGVWFIAGSVFREIAALRKLELKPWDYWGLVEALLRAPPAWPPQSRKKLDQLVSLLEKTDLESAHEPSELGFFELPDSVTSFPLGKAIQVPLRRS